MYVYVVCFGLPLTLIGYICAINIILFYSICFRSSCPTKDRKGLMPPKRTEKNIQAPKRTFICHYILLKCMLKIYMIEIFIFNVIFKNIQ